MSSVATRPGPIPLRGAERFPLSFAQQRLWFVDHLASGSVAYNAQRSLRFDGDLDVAFLERAIGEIVQRHHILRTTFARDGDAAVQVVGGWSPVSLDPVDLSELSEEEQAATITRLARLDAMEPFDLTKGPMVRFQLVRLGVRAHVLLVCLHHIVADGPSFVIFSRELAALHAAYVSGRAPDLPSLRIQYGDYAAWQRERMTEAGLRPLLAYWRPLIEGLPRLALGSGSLRRDGQESRDAHGAEVSVELSAPLAVALEALARQTRTTVFMIALAAFKLLLHHWTEAATIVVTADVSGRNQVETEPLIGLFVNQVVLRTEVATAPDVRALLGRVKTVVLGAYAHQDLPFERLVQELAPAGDGRRRPLSPVHVVYQHAARPGAQLDGLTIRTLRTAYTPARFDLTLFVRHMPDGLSIALVYRTSLFIHAEMTRRLAQLQTILAAIVDRPDATVQTLCLELATSERTQRHMEPTERPRAGAPTFRRLTPKPVVVSREPVRFGLLNGGDRLPLLVQPESAGLDVAAWVNEQHALVESKLIAHGAVLFRDFGIDTPARFEQFAQAVSADLFDENGEHVRASVSGRIYTPTFYPADKKVLWHNENSFNRMWPRLIMFCCIKPADEGGETPLVDSRKVFEALDPAIRERFIQKQVRYVRNYGSGLGLTWQDTFQTTDKTDVEYYCQSNGMQCHWKPNDRLRTECVRPAIVRHPRTGEAVWFNQAQHWHPSCLDPEVRATIMSLFSEDDLPRTCTYGDGTPIEDSVMAEICDVYRSLETKFPWQTGDVVVVDNLLIAHARNPFKGERKLCVALAEMMSYDDVQLA